MSEYWQAIVSHAKVAPSLFELLVVFSILCLALHVAVFSRRSGNLTKKAWKQIEFVWLALALIGVMGGALSSIRAQEKTELEANLNSATALFRDARRNLYEHLRESSVFCARAGYASTLLARAFSGQVFDFDRSPLKPEGRARSPSDGYCKAAEIARNNLNRNWLEPNASDGQYEFVIKRGGGVGLSVYRVPRNDHEAFLSLFSNNQHVELDRIETLLNELDADRLSELRSEYFRMRNSTIQFAVLEDKRSEMNGMTPLPIGLFTYLVVAGFAVRFTKATGELLHERDDQRRRANEAAAKRAPGNEHVDIERRGEGIREAQDTHQTSDPKNAAVDGTMQDEPDEVLAQDRPDVVAEARCVSKYLPPDSGSDPSDVGGPRS